MSKPISFGCMDMHFEKPQAQTHTHRSAKLIDLCARVDVFGTVPDFLKDATKDKC